MVMMMKQLNLLLFHGKMNVIPQSSKAHHTLCPLLCFCFSKLLNCLLFCFLPMIFFFFFDEIILSAITSPNDKKECKNIIVREGRKNLETFFFLFENEMV